MESLSHDDGGEEMQLDTIDFVPVSNGGGFLDSGVLTDIEPASTISSDQLPSIEPQQQQQQQEQQQQQQQQQEDGMSTSDESYKASSDDGSGDDDDDDDEDELALPDQNDLSLQAQEIRARLAQSERPILTGVMYDEGMLQHKHPKERHIESPERIRQMREHMINCGIFDLCRQYTSRPAVMDELLLVHSREYLKELYQTEFMNEEELNQHAQRVYNSIYLCNGSLKAALLACGGVITLVEAVLSGEVRNGFAMARPPGHHAESHEAMGFCLINNVAVAVRVAKNKHNLKRILIVDWDVHHGNGIQRAFQNDPDVLYISAHRYENAKFYPHSVDADLTFVGTNEAEGKTVNIPWSCRGMGDGDYLHAFQQVIMPIAHEFQPELVLVAAGFDAAQGDPIGGCGVTPAGYSQLTHMLLSLANGRVVLVLEGGYDLQAISMSGAACAAVLLGASPSNVDRAYPSDEAAVTVRKVIEIQSKYWRCLRPRSLDVRHYFHAGEENDVINIVDSNARSLGSYLRDVSSILDAYIPLLMIDAKMYHVPLSPEYSAVKFNVSGTALGDTRPLLLLFHGSGYIRYLDAQADNILKTSSAHLAGTILPYIDTALSEKMSVMAVHVLSSHKLNQDHGASEALKQAVLHVWDEYVVGRQSKAVVIVADTVGVHCLSALFGNRDVEKRIKGVVAFTEPNNPAIIPAGSKDKAQLFKDKANWFYENSMVMLSNYMDVGTELQLGPRFGRCYSTGSETSTDESLWTFHESAFEFLRRRIAAHSA